LLQNSLKKELDALGSEVIALR